MATAKKPAAKAAPKKEAKPAPKQAKPLPKAGVKPLSKATAQPSRAKAAPKKAEPKKAAPKKAESKKVAPKKAAPKKDEPKKPTAGAAYHLAKREDDGLWTVKLTNSTKVIKTFDTKAEAEAYVKAMAERQGRSVLTHNSKGKNKGRIQSK